LHFGRETTRAESCQGVRLHDVRFYPFRIGPRNGAAQGGFKCPDSFGHFANFDTGLRYLLMVAAKVDAERNRFRRGCPFFGATGNNCRVIQRTDSELLHDYVEGRSESAFTELVNRHVALVYSVARLAVVDEHLAQDVTQTTFTILAREARHLAWRALLSSWLHRTALNQAAKLVRGEMRRRAREQEAYAMQTVPIESDSDWKRIAPMLDAALDKLAKADRPAIHGGMYSSKSRSGRRRWTAKQRQRLLARFHENQLTQRDFANRHGVGLSILSKWLRVQSETPAPPVKF
jgi:hypothetical protein